MSRLSSGVNTTMHVLSTLWNLASLRIRFVPQWAHVKSSEFNHDFSAKYSKYTHHNNHCNLIGRLMYVAGCLIKINHSFDDLVLQPPVHAQRIIIMCKLIFVDLVKNETDTSNSRNLCICQRSKNHSI